ncbi:protein-L-isoaspartate O-methyltransferase [Oceanidesulfovibrio indonesiensis]|uniref:Protein-L-isoaspartate O-methyltransferase n=1 Tax=Oceanidesulfovibrio indonesiensis TaxID=54767 RepID=A0A7M3MEB3_9BACT|nr:protein-L-isoaspartate(D-aspartate) O-methyltransferase [Oceanidesulfovibrio indonesiensis]TVM17141.1 protein-L-isoaspartate O-methyltransferase [Oceanidesulfovibrio indonesiensis]
MKHFSYRVIIVVFSCLCAAADAHGQEYAEQRAALVDAIRQDVSNTVEHILGTPMETQVTEALKSVPRHEFVPDAQRNLAYLNQPLPIGYGQTISQPYVVALMTALLDPQPGDVVFELGTGSGYQAAVLAELVADVHTVEIVPPLAESATERLARLGYDNVQVAQGDGYYGKPQAAPFDGIVVTAAASHIPPPLVEQLKPGGRMIIPVGPAYQLQHLMLVEKDESGEVRTRSVLPVAFVPLTGGH